MSKSFIHINHKKSGDYTKIFHLSHNNNIKTVITENLGKVVDLKNGIFQNRQRGVFKYDVKNWFSLLDSPQNKLNTNIDLQEKVLIFGNTFLIDEILPQDGYNDLFRSVYPDNPDSLMTTLFYILINTESYANIDSWWKGTYANILFPNASVSSQRISELLANLWSENIIHNFFHNYLSQKYKKE